MSKPLRPDLSMDAGDAYRVAYRFDGKPVGCHTSCLQPAPFSFSSPNFASVPSGRTRFLVGRERYSDSREVPRALWIILELAAARRYRHSVSTQPATIRSTGREYSARRMFHGRHHR